MSPGPTVMLILIVSGQQCGEWHSRIRYEVLTTILVRRINSLVSKELYK